MAFTTVLVTQLIGQAWIRDTDGNLTPLRQGMRIPSDANVITASGSTVQLQADGQPPLTLGENQDVALNHGVFEDIPAAEAAVPASVDPLVNNLIAAINSGQDPLAELDATAATMVGGGGGGGGTFVRLSSVVEGTSPLALAYPRGASEVPEDRRGGAASTIDNADTANPVDPNPGTPSEDPPTLHVGDAGQINEGAPAHFDITLSKAVNADTTITFKLGGEVDADDIGTVSVTIGGQTVALNGPDANGNYSFTVPAGTTGGIQVQVQTVDDQVFEGPELLTLTATLSGSTANGTPLPAGITDTGSGTIVDQNPGEPGADVPTLEVGDAGQINEGAPAHFDITLSKAVNADTTITFKLGGEVDADDIGTVSVTIGGQTVALNGPDANGNYSFTVPAGTTGGIQVQVQTVDDQVFEGPELLTLTATLSGSTANGTPLPAGITDTGSGTIVDQNPGEPGADVPTLEVGDAGQINEGAPAHFDITLSKAVNADTTITFKLGGEVDADDIGTVSVTIGGQTVALNGPDANGNYSFTVPAGTTGGIQVQVQTVDDQVFEGPELLTLTATLSGSTANGTPLPAGITDTGSGTIVDQNPGEPGADVPTLDVADAGQINEGAPAHFDITLSKAVNADTTITFKLGGEVDADDIGTVSVTIGGQTVALNGPDANGNYSFTVPAGTTGGIQVQVQTVDDQVFEGPELLTLTATLSGSTANGTPLPAGITDTGSGTIVDQNPGEPGADVPTLDVADAGQINEGAPAHFDITLSKAVNADTTITFKLGGEVDADDIGTVSVTIGGQTVALNGPDANGNYSFTVPAGTTGGIQVQVQTVDDQVFEGPELLTLTATLSGSTANGTPLPAGITDTGSGTIVDQNPGEPGADVPTLEVGDAGQINEGAPAHFDITLSKAVNADTTITFKLGGEVDADDIGTVSVTIGGQTVALNGPDANGNYSFTVPAGTTGGIQVQVQTVDDQVFEGPELLTLTATLSGSTANGTPLPAGITDTGSGTIVDQNPGEPGADVPTLDVADAGQINEGAPAHFDITLSKAVNADTTITFKLGGEVDADDIGTVSVTIGGQTVALNGPDANGNYSFTVPAGTTGGIQVQVQTVDDQVFEGPELLTLTATLSGSTANGTPLPAGITDTGSGTIVDQNPGEPGADVPTLEVGDAGQINEGAPAHFDITLSKAVNADTTITFKLGGEVDADDIGTVSVTIGGQTVALNGPDANGNYSFTVPAGTTGGIQVQVQTVDDQVFEGPELLTLTATLSGSTANGTPLPAGITDTGSGTIVDQNPGEPGADVPTLDVADAGQINEGAPAHFDITLSKAVNADTTITFKLGGEVDADDIGTVSVTIGGQTVALNGPDANGNYSFTVPAGTTGGIQVQVQTVDDQVFEGPELLTLTATLSGSTANGTPLPVGITDTGSGTIVDQNPGEPGADVPTLEVGDAGQINEGAPAHFDITLSKAVNADTTITFKLGGEVDADDIGTVSVTIGGQTVALNGPDANGNYSFTVPAGTTGGIQVQVQTVDDQVFEGPELLTLTATLSGSTANGTPLPAGITDTGSGTIVDQNPGEPGADVPTLDVADAGQINEGAPAHFDITLSKAVNADTTITFKLGGEVDADDIGTVSVTIGGQTVALNGPDANGNYSFTVPAGTTGGIQVQVQTVDDQVFEGPELLTLTATLSGSTANGTPLPAGITDTGSGTIVDQNPGEPGADVPTLEVGDAGQINEGAPAHFDITLSKAVNADTTITFKLGGEVDADDIGTVSVTIGGQTVALNGPDANGNYSFTVPAGTTGGIQVQVQTVDDQVFEGPELLTLTATLSGSTANGTPLPAGITDTGSGTIVDQNPGEPGADVPTLEVGDAGQINEGAPAHFDITLSKAVNADTTITFKLGGEVDADDIGTVSVTIGGQTVALNGPDANGNYSFTVPAGTTGGIQVQVQTVDDQVFEGPELLTLTATLSGSTANGTPLPAGITDTGSGTIVDQNPGEPGADVPTLDVADAGQINEGAPAHFDITLSKAVNADTTITFKLGGEVDADDIGTVSVTIGGQTVALNGPDANGNYSFTVPAGTTGGIQVQVQTVDDQVFEGPELLTLTATLSGSTANGTPLPVGITDTGSGTIVDQNPGEPGADVPTLEVGDAGQINEGAPAHFDITLSKAVNADTTITFKLGGEVDADDIGTVSVTIGGQTVALNGPDANGNYSFTVPAGTTGGIQVQVQTVDDQVFEGPELLTLTATLSGSTANGTPLPAGITDTGSGTIVDQNPGEPGADVPTLEVGDAGQINEGAPAHFDITLSKAVNADTTITFKLGGEVDADDIGTVSVTIGGQTVALNGPDANGNYSFTVPAGTTGGIQVQVQTVDDQVFEGPELLTLTATLSGSTANGTPLPAGITDTGSGTIVDQNPGEPGADVPTLDVADAGQINEGAPAHFDITLSKAVNADTTITFKLGGEVDADDIGTVSVTIGGQTVALNGPDANGNYSFTVPAGTTGGIQVQVQTVDDQVFEGPELLTLTATLSGSTANGTPLPAGITDTGSGTIVDQNPGEPGADVPTLDVADAGQINEGAPAHFDITLSKAVNADTTITFKLGGEVDADDIGTVSVTIGGQTVALNGPDANGNYSFTVPAGTTGGIQVQVQTVDDQVFEGPELLTLTATLSGSTANGTPLPAGITDTGSGTIVDQNPGEPGADVPTLEVGDAGQINEGAPAHFDITLSKAVNADTTITFKLGGEVDADDIGTVSVTIGGQTVALNGPDANGNYSFTVPAGTTGGIQVQVQTVDDQVFEGPELLTLTATLSGSTANGTPLPAGITDTGSGTIVDQNPGEPGADVPTLDVADAGQINEGAPAHFDITLSKAVNADTTITFKLGGEVDADDIGTVSVTIGGQTVALNGPDANGNYSFTVPAGTTGGIQVQVQTVDDQVFEGPELLTLTATLSGSTANGTPLPAGITDTGSGTIVDQNPGEPGADVPTLEVGDAGQINEGAPAHFDITLSKAVNADTTITFKLGGEVDADDIGTVSVTIGGQTVALNGPDANGNYSFTVPAGTTGGIQVQVQTVDDQVFEGPELLTLTATLSGSTANGTPLPAGITDTGSGTIVDQNPGEPGADVPTLDVADAGQINEGAPAHFDITLSKAVNADTTITFKLGGEVDADDIGTVSVTIGGQTVALNGPDANGNYSFTVPAGTTGGIQVQVQTVDDQVFEGPELLTLTATLSGSTANGTPLPVGITDTGSGTIVDQNPGEPGADVPTLEVGDAGQINEGAPAHFDITLSKAVNADTTITFKLGGEVDADDIGTVSVTIGGQTVALNGPDANGNYSFTVPAGTTGGIQVQVQTVDDQVFEGPELLTLTATLSGSTANGTPLPAGITDTGSGTIVDQNPGEPGADVPTLDVADAGQINEGAPAHFDITLSKAVNADTTITFKLGGEVDADDIGTVSVTIGGQTVALNGPDANGNYSFTVPAGTTGGIQVQVQTVDDQVFEGPELLTLTATLSGSTANGTPLPAGITDTGSGTIVDQNPGEPGADVPTLEVGDAGQINEGAPAHFDITLSKAVNADTTITFKLGGEVDADDIGTVSVTIGGQTVALNGPDANGNYSFTVPAGTTGGIQVQVQTVDDQVFEGPELLTLTATLSGSTANGTPLPAGITDTGSGTIVDQNPGEPGADVPTLEVGDAGQINEGAPAHFDITLSKAVNADTTITFKLGGEVDADDIGTVSVTIGGQTVALNGPDANGNYSFTVPAGTTGGIQVQVQTVDDQVFEGPELLTLTATLSGSTANGTPLPAGITDTGSGTIVDQNPGEPGADVPTLEVGDAGQINEGAPAHFDITLSKAVNADTTITFKLGGEVDADDIGTVSVTIGGQTVALNGPDANGNYSFTVPAGTTGGIQVQVQTVDDQVFEGPELLTLTATLSGSTANGTPLPVGITDTGSGTIVDQNPGEPGADVPTLDVADAGQINEGAPAHFDITLSKAVNADTTITFKLGGEVDADDIGTVSVTIGGQTVALNGPDANGNYSFTVPAGTTGGIQVQVQTVDDQVFEGPELLTLTATLSGSTANGTPLPAGITDTGSGTIVDQNPGEPGADVPTLDVADAGQINEGAPAHFDITLSKAVNADTTITFKLGGEVDADDIGTVSVTIGGQTVALNGPDANGNYSFTVPAGTTGGIQVQVQTVDDQVFEGPELLTLTATLSGSTANGTPLPAGITDTGSGTIVDQNPVEPGSESAGGKVEGVEDTELTIKWSDLKIISTKPDLGIYIASLPVNGVLKFNGEALTPKDLEGLGKYISQADIAAGKLIFVPAANESGFDGLNGGEGEGNRMGDYASFGFRPAIGEYAADIAKLVIDIKPVVDAPSIDLTKLTTESVRIPEIKVTVTEGSIVMSGGNVKVSGLELVTPGGSNAIGPNNKAELIDIRSGFGNITNIAAEVKDYLLLGKDFVKYKIVGSYSGGTFSGNITDLDTGKTITVSHLGGLIFADGNTSYLPSTSTTTITTGGFDRVVVELDAMLGEDRDGSESLSDITLSGLNGATVESIVDKSGKPIAFTSNSDGTVTILNAGHTSMEDVKITIKVPLDAGNLELRAEVSANEQGLADSDKVTVSDDLTLAAYTTLTGGVGGDNLNGTGGNDLVVSDVQGLQILPGKNYNIALIVDTSGSMGDKAVADAVKALKDVITQLITSAKGASSGTVNLYLSDFDSTLQGSVSVNLKSFTDANKDGFPDVIQALLDSMKSGGGTNYEVAFKDAANWFSSDQVKGNSGTNLTYFITDGQPTFYQKDEQTNPVLVDFINNPDLTLDQILKNANYKPGDVVKMSLGGVERTIVSANGTVYKWTQSTDIYGREVWNYKTLTTTENETTAGTTLKAQGDGTYELSTRGGTGSSTDQATTTNSLQAFALLAKLSTVEAIGLGPSLSANDLKSYDTDGVVQANIDAANLADAILGKNNNLPLGDDIAHGGNGNDILFGDQIKIGDLEGFAALQKLVADKVGGGLEASKVTVEQVHDYITKHHADFAQLETVGGGKDELHGGAGNDILYGQGGDDKLFGDEGNDILYGGTGNDYLDGGTGNDILVGGKGNDTLIGGEGDDIFVWLKGDQGTVAAPAADVVKDFGNGNDKLDLRDLLQGEEKVTDLSKFLHFGIENGSTVIKVSSAGGLTATGANFDQKITLEGVNWSAADTASAQNDLIKDLIKQGKLLVDGNHQ